MAAVLAATGCAARGTSPQTMAALASAAALPRQGCYLCLQDAASILAQQVAPAPASSATSVTRVVATVGLVVAMALSPVAAQPETLEVVFSVPGQDEAGVSLAALIRLQFSAPLDASTLKDQITLAYSAEDSRERGEPEPPAVEFSTSYDAADRALTICPTRSWERFREARLTLGAGIRSATGERLKPYTLIFTTGGS